MLKEESCKAQKKNMPSVSPSISILNRGVFSYKVNRIVNPLTLQIKRENNLHCDLSKTRL